MPLPVWAPAAASAVVGFLGAERGNRINQREARLNRAFQAQEAATNRAFQERMRNTEWQAAVKDMVAAGINPAVAYARGGASSPGGSMAGGATAAPAENGVSSAMQALVMRKNLALLDAQVKKTEQEAMAAGAAAQTAFRASQWDARRWEYYFDEQGRPKGTFRQLLDAEFSTNLASSARSVADARLAEFSIPERKAVADLFARVGEGGKLFQMLLPILMNVSAGYARGR